MHHKLILLIVALLLFCSYFLIFKSTGSNSLLQPGTIVTTHAPSPTPLPSPKISMGFVGDLGLGRHITSTARSKNDFSWSFQGISKWLSNNDLNVANLESPIIENCPHGPTGTFTFCGDTRFLPELEKYDFIFNLNNNHILNYGHDGLSQTRDFLPNNSFFENFHTRDISGIKFGYLGYDFVTYPKTNQLEILNRVRQRRPEVDYLIVSIHWGNEYLKTPESWRVKFARELVDAGADIIHGHHPHVWQGVEEYKGKLIFYSFGNFIFDQSWSYETSHSRIARVHFQKDEPLTYELFPIEIKFNSQPWLVP